MGKYSTKPTEVGASSVGTSELVNLAVTGDKIADATIGSDKLEAGSELLVTGWSDNLQTFSSARGRGTNEPVWSDVGNGDYSMLFTAGDELFVSHHVNHDYEQGTDAYPHIHFLSNAAENVGVTVVWRYSYIIAKGHAQGDSLTGALTTFDMTYTYLGTEVAGDHIIVECSDLQAFDLLEPDTFVKAGVQLFSTTATGDIFGLMSDLHYRSGTHNTINKVPNFYGP